ncbi:MAG: hypothetical protein QNJ16_07305 [Rhodobacter sp.]|nr:hypothetical protein [Rhodobacter sp.]
MLSYILLSIASARFSTLLLIYIFSLTLIVAFGAGILIAVKTKFQLIPLEALSFSDIIIESATHTLGYGNAVDEEYANLNSNLALGQRLFAILFNSVFIALLVFRAIRVNHTALMFANHVLLSKKSGDEWSLEFRIGNNSKFDIADVKIRIQLVEILDSFPRSTAHKTCKVILNYDEYIILDAFGYLLVSSSSKPITSSGERIAEIDESLLSKRFFLRVLVQGHYVRSGLPFVQTHIYDGSSVSAGKWRYYLKEDLERRGKIMIDRFSAFDIQVNK